MEKNAMIGDISPILDDSKSDTPERKGKTPIVALESDIFNDVDVKLTAILGNGILTVRTLLDLSEGSVIDLDTPLDGMIDLVLNHHLIARGEIVAVGDKFGVRITTITAERQ
jgi:flagellar motor switch protein FliN